MDLRRWSECWCFENDEHTLLIVFFTPQNWVSVSSITANINQHASYRMSSLLITAGNIKRNESRCRKDWLERTKKCSIRGGRRKAEREVRPRRLQVYGGHDYFKGLISSGRSRLPAPSQQWEAPSAGNGTANYQCFKVSFYFYLFIKKHLVSQH